MPAWQEEATLLPTGDAIGDTGDRFGASVAADGDTIAVGVPYQTNGAGCVRVSVRTGATWSEEARITAPVSGIDGFGQLLVLDGDTLAIVGTRHSDISRAVYIYVRNAGAWSLQSTLAAPSLASGFGEALALSGDSLVVGAPGAGTPLGSSTGAAYVYVRSANTWAVEQKVFGADGALGDGFGQAIAIDGDRLAVGSPYDDAGATANVGSTYVFSRSGGQWTQVAKLSDPAGDTNCRLGSAVAIVGSTLAVGAPGAPGLGRVHVYEDLAGTWTHRAVVAPTGSGAGFGGALAIGAGQLLVGHEGWDNGGAELIVGSGDAWASASTFLPAGLAPGDDYGRAVDLSGGTVVVSAPGWLQTGAAWVWTGSGSMWALQAVLSGPGTARDDSFGAATALDGALLVVGAPNDDTTAGRKSGAAYVFEHTASGWVLRQKLLPPAGLPGTIGNELAFGTAVAVSGDRVVVGAPQARGSGRVFAFARSGGAWTLVAELAASDAAPSSAFGRALALRGTRLLVGAPNAPADSPPATPDGAVYAFEELGGVWLQQQKLTLPSPPTYGAFGWAVAFSPSGTRAIVGAPGAASAQILSLAGASWIGQEVLHTEPPAAYDAFGGAVAIGEEDVFVGAPATLGPGPEEGKGAFHVFHPTGGVLQGTRFQGDASGSRLGAAIASDGTNLFVGAPGGPASAPPREAGALHVYEHAGGSWTRAAVLDGLDSAFAAFGASVTAAAGRIFIGEPGSSQAAPGAGAVHVLASTVLEMGIGLAGPATARQGDVVPFTIALANAGTSAAAITAFDFSVAPGLVFQDWSLPSGSCEAVGSTLTCSVRSVPVGTSTVATVRLVPTTAGSFSLTASLAAADANPANDSATATLGVTATTADVSVWTQAYSPYYAQVGGFLEYVVYVGNSGPETAAGLTLELPTPPGLVLHNSYSAFGCTPADCRIASLPVTSTPVERVRITYYVPAGYAGPAPIAFTASVTTLSQDPQPANNQRALSWPFLPPPTPLSYYSLPPCRLYDSRATGGILAGGTARILEVPDLHCGVPSHARAVALNVTVTGATAAGNVRVYPGYSPIPTTSTINFTAGLTRANNAVVGLGPTWGELAIFASPASTSVHVIVDVTGYFQ